MPAGLLYPLTLPRILCLLCAFPRPLLPYMPVYLLRLPRLRFARLRRLLRFARFAFCAPAAHYHTFTAARLR